MFALSILTFSLLPISNALSIANNRLDTGASRPANVLGPVSKLVIANNYVAPDGFNRSAVLVNGVYPAPLIRANKGDDFSLQLINQLTDNTMAVETSIHWHGIHQQRTNWADGASGVTQCPLRQEEAFTAQFNPGQQTGTYWYHSHFSTQYCDGLRGPLVIYDPFDPLGYLYDVDDESTVITLSDWYHPSALFLGSLFQPINPNSTLINSSGRYPGGPAVPLSVINVEHGLRYRFRLVSTSCSAYFNFTMDGHRMTVIEADGDEVVPVDVDWIIVHPGQRYSVVVTANQPVGNYWIRVPSEFSSTFEGGQNLAILRYAGAPDQDPTSTPGPYELGFDETLLHALINPPAPGIPELGKADVNLQLHPGFNFSTRLFSFNNVSFSPPDVPVLLQILSGARHASQLLPPGSVYELPLNQVIEISFPSPLAVGPPHPIHLHGHSFSVVRSAGSNTTNFLNPVRRDVVSLGLSATDNVVIRFVTDNAGPWFLHCHVDWHLNHGLAVVMAEAPAVAAQQQGAVVPDDWKQLCQPGTPWGQTYLGTVKN